MLSLHSQFPYTNILFKPKVRVNTFDHVNKTKKYILYSTHKKNSLNWKKWAFLLPSWLFLAFQFPWQTLLYQIINTSLSNEDFNFNTFHQWRLLLLLLLTNLLLRIEVRDSRFSNGGSLDRRGCFTLPIIKTVKRFFPRKLFRFLHRLRLWGLAPIIGLLRLFRYRFRCRSRRWLDDQIIMLRYLVPGY